MKQKMKYVGILFVLCVAFASCQNDKSKQKSEQIEIAPTFCKEDTIEVARLATEYLEHLKNKEFDLALQMLNHMRNDSILALSEEEKRDLQQQYQTFPVLAYKIEGISLNDEYTTEVMYSVEFFKKEPGQEEVPNTMKFRLNPQKINDIWYLGVLNR